ncbi:terminase [Shewanella sp. NFH-SH190041]|uniref:terminase large subunit n=1 Tax=Shewanella sp. NFH-SH190041 TaxID=2950245 RepID=UPI0021C3F158|nr:terminase TerL endonuclease subunit [Shewanella sp. NFH-SH190041]BDM64548.1 terminase [Shewanella sp. NFH-SH190041]
MPKFSCVVSAHKYARDVVSGKIPACHHVINACKRHLYDLERSQADKTFPYYFDKVRGERACTFMQQLVHTKGQWAKKPLNERKIKLEPWQKFIHVVLYGWLRRSDKTRRFRQAYIEVPRKNGKSIIAAGNGLYTFCADGEGAPEVYAGATTEKQAHEVFKPAKLIASALPMLRSAFHVDVCAKKLVKPDGSVFEPVIGNPGDGASPHCAIVDEYHEHDNPDLYDTMQTGMGARTQPLMFVITTAGSNLAGPCKDLHDDVIKILDGSITDDEIFGIIYTIDEGDDWTDPKVLEKANPNIGVSVDKGYLLSQQLRAMRSPRYASIFKTKHLDVWVNASSAFFNMEDWRSAEDLSLKIDDFVGDPAWFALDLASKLDICSFVQVFTRRDDNGLLHYYVFSRHYLPEETIFNPDQKNTELYKKWVSTPWANSDGSALKPTDGAEIDFGTIGYEVIDLADGHSVREVPHDPWNAAQLAQQLNTEGLPVVKIPQNTAHLSPGMKELEAALKAGRLHHDGNPVLTWMMSNVISKTDANENEFPRKDKPDQKIDGAVALIMGVGRAMLDEGDCFNALADFNEEDFVL